MERDRGKRLGRVAARLPSKKRGTDKVFSRSRDSIRRKAPFLTLRQRHPTFHPDLAGCVTRLTSSALVFNHLVSQSIRRDRVLWRPLFPG